MAEGLQGDRIEKPQVDLRLFLRLFGFGLPYLRLLLLGVALIILASAAAVVTPLIVKSAIDDHIFRGDAPGLRRMVLLYLAVVTLQALFGYLQGYCTQMLGQRVMFDLRNRIFGHLQRLSMPFFDRNPVGRIVTRITSDVENLNQLFTQGIVSIFGDLFLIGGILAGLWITSPTLSLWTFTVLPLLLAATFVFRRLVRKGFDDIRYHLARINAALQENITGMETVQLFLREGLNFRRFAGINREHTRAHERTILCFAVFFPLVELLSAVALALVIWRGGIAVGAGTLSLGAVFAFIRYLEMFFRPVSDLAEKYNIILAAVVSSERIFHLLDETPAVRDRPAARAAVPPVERIDFEEVVFGYDPAEPVLKGVSFSVGRGETVALVGHTGAGKTTCFNLLQRFYDVQEGAIRLNGSDIRAYRQRSLRRLMAVVLQEPFLFSGTVAENIRLGDPSISDEAVVEAARLARAHEFIEQLPGGYGHELVERGANLSTGQKQLIAFARAMAFDPEVLLLDEATANIDSTTELLIRRAVAALTRRRTSLVIAHRLSTIQHADRIVVLHKGRKVEEGTHRELLGRRALYWRLYRLQYREERLRSA